MAGLGLLDRLDDLLERGVRADLRRLDRQQPVLVDRRADDLVAFALLDGDRLACHHRFVDGGLALDDHAVGRDLFTRPDFHQVASLNVFQGDLPFGPVRADERRRLGFHLQKFPERLAGLALRAGFEVVTQRDEHEDQRRGVEVDLPRNQPSKHRDGVEIRRRGPQCDEHVHIGPAVVHQGIVGVLVERPAEQCLDGRRKQELDPAQPDADECLDGSDDPAVEKEFVGHEHEHRSRQQRAKQRQPELLSDLGLPCCVARTRLGAVVVAVLADG